MPLALAVLDYSFRPSLPFWMAGFFQAAFTHRRVSRQRRRAAQIYLATFLLLATAITLLQHDWLSGSWTMPLTHLLWFWLGVPAGQHFFAVRATEPGWEADSADPPPRRLL